MDVSLHDHVAQSAARVARALDPESPQAGDSRRIEELLVDLSAEVLQLSVERIRALRVGASMDVAALDTAIDQLQEQRVMLREQLEASSTST